MYMQLIQVDCLTVEWIRVKAAHIILHLAVPRPPLFLPSVCIHYNTRRAVMNREDLGVFIT